MPPALSIFACALLQLEQSLTGILDLAQGTELHACFTMTRLQQGLWERRNGAESLFYVATIIRTECPLCAKSGHSALR
jgi:hypothetical protein